MHIDKTPFGKVPLWVDRLVEGPDEYFSLSTINDAISAIRFVQFYMPKHPGQVITELNIAGTIDMIPLLQWIKDRDLTFKLHIHTPMPDFELIDFIEEQNWKYTVDEGSYDKV